MLPKTSAYVESYGGQTKRMYFLIEDDDLLKKYNNIWDKVSADVKIIWKEPIYKKEFLKTKIKSYGYEVKNFIIKNIPKVVSNHTCLAVISLDSALKKDKNYYPQNFLKECKYFEKEYLDILIIIWVILLLLSLVKNKLK